LKYPLEDAVCWTLERDSVLRRIWAVWSRRRSERFQLLDTDNLQPTALTTQERGTLDSSLHQKIPFHSFHDWPN